MNQRREPRFQANQLVGVTFYGNPELKLSARIRNVSGKGLGIEVDRPVAPGSALKVDLDDALLLGEVIFCRQDETGFYLGVELQHALTGLAELSRMVNSYEEAFEVPHVRSAHIPT